MMGPLAFSAGLAFLIVALGTGLLIPILKRFRVFDRPNERSSHKVSTPRGGGVLVVAAVLLVWLVSWSAGNASVLVTAATFKTMVVAAGLLAAISWIDDLRGLPALVRLLAHGAAAAALLWSWPADTMVFQGLLPLWVDRLFAGLLLVWFINLYNFMDGIDGLTAAQTLFMGLGLAGLFSLGSGETVTPRLALALAGAAFGFWVWNREPARVFLGDVGSIPLGFLLGGLLLLAAAHGAWASALILPLYYLADSGITLTRRLLRGERIWQAHREHFYQRPIQAGCSHRRVVAAVALCNLALLVLSMTALLPGFAPASLIAAVGVVALLLVCLRRWAVPRA